MCCVTACWDFILPGEVVGVRVRGWRILIQISTSSFLVGFERVPVLGTLYDVLWGMTLEKFMAGPPVEEWYGLFAFLGVDCR